jgi:7-cyano-7-deazaguanine synthase
LEGGRVMDDSQVIVLFSGGLDSLACYYWAKERYKDIMGLYVNLDTSYTIAEIVKAKKMCFDLNLDFKVVDMKFMGIFSDKVGHVPLRNIFLLEIAALYGNTILFGMLHGELSEDKGFPFLRRMQRLFDSQTKENLYHAKSKIELLAPFGNKTKTQVVKYLLDQKVTPFQLSETIGCLKGTVCGECPPCFNRWVAFENNKLYDIDDYFSHPVFWGIEEFKRSRSTNKNMFKKSLLSIPLWEKRKWIMDVWRAYKSAYDRNLCAITPGTVLKTILKG